MMRSMAALRLETRSRRVSISWLSSSWLFPVHPPVGHYVTSTSTRCSMLLPMPW